MTSSASAARRIPFIVAGVLALSACGKDTSEGPGTTADASTPASAAAQAEEDLADVSQYRLSMDKIDKYMAAQRNIATKAASLTPAQRAAMEANSENSSDPNASLDDMVRRIESEPMMVAAIRDAGLSAREFTMITISMMQTGMAAAVAKMRPTDNQDSLIRAMKANPDNIKFWNENEAEITRKSRDIESQMKKLGVSDDS